MEIRINITIVNKTIVAILRVSHTEMYTAQISNTHIYFFVKFKHILDVEWLKQKRMVMRGSTKHKMNGKLILKNRSILAYYWFLFSIFLERPAGSEMKGTVDLAGIRKQRVTNKLKIN